MIFHWAVGMRLTLDKIYNILYFQNTDLSIETITLK